MVFDAVATSLSFKAAASSLSVSPPAVSQQIKALEAWLEVPLFERKPRSIRLTPAGEFYSQVAADLVATHKQGHMRFLRRFQNSSLNVSAPLFIAQEFMIPNYLSFKQFLSDTELRIEARSSYVDFDRDPLEAAIRFGDGNWPGLDCRLLCPADLAPVCSPAYAAKNNLVDVQQLKDQKLISPTEDLSQWRVLLGQAADQLDDIFVCDSYLAAIKAASEGVGITLALLPSTNAWVNDGRLVLPFDIRIPSARGYWMVSPQGGHRAREIEAFHQWALSLFDGLPPIKKTLNAVSLPL
tara:strand:- start:1658 stop:2545 length:888 start_codon:yes stop_codon:yes gene_type:complete